MSQPVVLFVCVRNAGRSQIAEALFNEHAGDRAVARSAGSRPAEAVHPEVVESLREVGLDVSAAQPKGLSAEILEGVDVVVGMGCGDECPAVPGANRIEWDIPDPFGRSRDEVDRTRDDIAQRVENLITQLGLR